MIADDENQTHYNVEMQVLRKKHPGKRSRYYHSQIDMELLRTGMEYGLLPDAYVIFICDFDPFYKKKYKYTFDTICKEERDAGRTEGVVKGIVKGRVDSILELLSELGEIPEDLQERISVEKDPDVLKSYLKIASASETIEEFRRKTSQL